MSDEAIPTPGGRIARRVLNIFFIADRSGSMEGAKIGALNQAIREVIEPLRQAAAAHPQVEMKVRAIRFSDDADWHIGPDSVGIDQFTWPDLKAGGRTSTAKALALLTTELDIERMPRRGFPPVCILISDGHCTDSEADYDLAIKRLTEIPWGMKAVRLAIGVGDDYSTEELLKFVSHKDVGVLDARTADQLIQYIKWASIAASISASAGKSAVSQTQRNTAVTLPPPPEPVAIVNPTECF